MSYSEQDVIDQYRYFLKDHVRLTIDFRKTDQRMGFDPPPVGKELSKMEWRYDRAAHKVIAIDVGRVYQNLYLATSVINAGTCAIAAYHQELMDRLLSVDGEDEFAIYMAAVGKVNESMPAS